MAVDEAILESAALPTLRFYRWMPGDVSIGYFQTIESAVRLLDCRKRQRDVVRRPTGGGLVEHGEDLTVSLVMPGDDARLPGRAADSYRIIHEIYRQGLRPFFPGLDFGPASRALRPRGDRLCFKEPVASDLELDGRKVVGSSQRRRSGKVLHQSAIFLSADMPAMVEALTKAFCSAWGIEICEGGLSAGEERLADTLIKTKYSRADYGFSGAVP